MQFTKTWGFETAPWTAFRDMTAIKKAMAEDLGKRQGRLYENSDFALKVVIDGRNFFVTDLFQRILLSDRKNEKLVLVLPCPENPCYISVVENLNKFRVSCRNVEVFFFDEYANEKGEVAPWQSPYSRTGQWMKFFYQRLDPELRMPMKQIHFWTMENAGSYSDLLDSFGGADVIYSEFGWTGLRNIDAEGFAAQTMEEFEKLGSRVVTPNVEQISLDSLRGMFGSSGDISSVPPCTATIGPRDLMHAKLNMNYNFIHAANKANWLQAPGIHLAFAGPVCPANPGSILRTLPGECYITEEIARPIPLPENYDWLPGKIEEIRKAEGRNRE